MSPGPPTPYLRASDEDREAAVDRLHRAAVEGRLEPDELEERLAAAYAARWTSDLEVLTADITPPAAYPVALPPPIGYPMPYRPPKTTNGMAAASMIAGFLWLGWLGSICAVIFGHIALSQIKRAEGSQTGHGMAVTGLVVGYLALAVLLVKIGVPGA
jgi:hypothetical protein